MSDIVEAIEGAVEAPKESRLNSLVAIVVAATATFMALCNVKGGNITQGKAEEQAAVINSWSYYQAKSTKQNIAETTLDLLKVQRESAGVPSTAAALDQRIAAYTAEIVRYTREKNEVHDQAEAHQKAHDDLGVRGDQFDMAQGVLSLAIALLGMVALTQKRWLLAGAVVMLAAGSVLGVAGFVGWSFHPAWLAKILT